MLAWKSKDTVGELLAKLDHERRCSDNYRKQAEQWRSDARELHHVARRLLDRHQDTLGDSRTEETNALLSGYTTKLAEIAKRL